jgi:hypothetical protein
MTRLRRDGVVLLLPDLGGDSHLRMSCCLSLSSMLFQVLKRLLYCLLQLHVPLEKTYCCWLHRAVTDDHASHRCGLDAAASVP